MAGAILEPTSWYPRYLAIMAEDSLTSRADGIETRFSLAYARSFVSEHRVALITVAISLVSLIIYRLMWYLPGLEGPAVTVQNNFVRQADAFLHGHIDMGPNGGRLEAFIELAINDGKYYIIPPPMPAIIILPGVVIWGLALNQTLVSTVIGAINSGTVYNVTRSVSKIGSPRATSGASTARPTFDAA